jgi:dihydroorotate dehydrogenase (fumarate)
MDDLLHKIYESTNLTIGLKMVPYFERYSFDKAIDIIENYPVNFLTCINSVPNATMIEDDKYVTDPNNHLAGLGGSVILPIGLANVKTFKELTDIPLIGVGGISSKSDVQRYLKAGASAVQIGTLLQREGPEIFKKLI